MVTKTTNRTLNRTNAFILPLPRQVFCYAFYKNQTRKKEYMHKNALDLIQTSKLPYTLTTYQAENLVQHYLFPTRIDLYIKRDDVTKWHEELTTDGLVGKGNLRLLIADEHIFYGAFKRQNLTVVSIAQLIVDLLQEGGVCIEAAEKLINKMEQQAT
jgi:hypothetical protein